MANLAQPGSRMVEAGELEELLSEFFVKRLQFRKAAKCTAEEVIATQR